MTFLGVFQKRRATWAEGMTNLEPFGSGLQGPGGLSDGWHEHSDSSRYTQLQSTIWYIQHHLQSQREVDQRYTPILLRCPQYLQVIHCSSSILRLAPCYEYSCRTRRKSGDRLEMLNQTVHPTSGSSFGAILISGLVSTHPSLGASPDPNPHSIRALNLTQNRVGTGQEPRLVIG